MLRAGTQAALTAFALSGQAVFALYTMVLSVHPSDAVVTSIKLGLVALATVFVAVSVVCRARLSRKSPVLGA